MGFDIVDWLTALCAIAAATIFGLIAAAIGSAAQRRYRRRLGAVRDRARGIPVAAGAAPRSLARLQSATPKIDRVARRWLPRRDLLAARLARTGRAITIGQYGLLIVGMAALWQLAACAASPRSAWLPTCWSDCCSGWRSLTW